MIVAVSLTLFVSSAAETVTVCAVPQSLVVKVRLVGLIVTSVFPVTVGVTVTEADGAAVRTAV